VRLRTSGPTGFGCMYRRETQQAWSAAHVGQMQNSTTTRGTMRHYAGST
jgi:hypothetical protein